MEDFETTIDLNMDAFIPDTYISNEYQKLDIYKRTAGIETTQDCDEYAGRASGSFWGSRRQCVC